MATHDAPAPASDAAQAGAAWLGLRPPVPARVEQRCPVCGSRRRQEVGPGYWPELIDAWHLSSLEALRLAARESVRCRTCRATLRSMTMAQALRATYGSRLPLLA